MNLSGAMPPKEPGPGLMARTYQRIYIGLSVDSTIMVLCTLALIDVEKHLAAGPESEPLPMPEPRVVLNKLKLQSTVKWPSRV